MKTNMRYFFKVIFTPKCWRQKLGIYSAVWDDHFNYLMRSHKFVRVTESIASLGNIQIIWIDGVPFSGGRRPSRSTTLRAIDKYVKECGALK